MAVGADHHRVLPAGKTGERALRNPDRGGPECHVAAVTADLPATTRRLARAMALAA